jgi:hypothetical protein
MQLDASQEIQRYKPNLKYLFESKNLQKPTEAFKKFEPNLESNLIALATSEMFALVFSQIAEIELMLEIL